MATAQTEALLVEDAAGVRTLTLNRPERRNALSLELMRDLLDALARTAADASVEVVVVRGAGPAFCSGHDLAEMVGCDLPGARGLFETCSELMMAVHRLPQPVIARVHGIATAAGCQLVSMCDLAVAADTARFALPGIDIGVFCSTPAVGVARNVGRKRAMEMLLTGETIDAPTALSWGLVNRVVPEAELDLAVKRFTDRICARSGPVIGLGKRTFYEQIEERIEAAYVTAGRTMCGNLGLPDAASGMDAFLNRRK
jgi:enoyl-CoA hydratase/carnithine racemase